MFADKRRLPCLVTTPKLAVFEDEQKAQLLKDLLNSTNPDDLQAANRLIQTLVKSVCRFDFPIGHMKKEYSTAYK